MKVLVTGATGLQGGSVARALRAAGHEVVALTRRPESDAGAALRELGAVVVRGDLGDAAATREAVAGVDAVFGLTNYWEHFAREVDHGKNLVDACRDRRVHLVLSTLASAEVVSGGAISVPHLETKRAIEGHARASGAPVTFVHVAFYYENFLSWFAPRQDARGVAVFGFPQGDAPLAAVSVEDVGPVVASVLEGGEEPSGRTVGVVGDELACEKYAAAMARALGEPVEYQPIPRDVFASFGFPGAADLAAMFDFTRRFVPSRQDDLDDTRRRHPGAQRFEAWATRRAAALREAIARSSRG